MKTTTHPAGRSSRFCCALAFISLLVAPEAWAWPNLAVVKTGPAQAAPGDLINYTLAYTNSGPVKGQSVLLKDFLPSYLTVQTNTLNGGVLAGSTITWNVGNVSSHASGSRSFQVRVNTNTPSGLSLTNRSQIFGSEAEEPGKTNNNYSTWITRITNRAPAAQNDAYTATEDTTLAISAPGVLTNDSDPDGNSLTAILVGGPAHGTLTLNANGSFSYQPAANYSGSDSFTYKASDGATNSSIATVNITINAANDAPVAANDSYTTAEDTILNVTAPGVLGNDSDADGNTLKAILVSGPTHGILVLNTNGGFSYTPADNYTGGDSFTYKANDGTANSGIATANITVTAVNDAPVAINDSYTTPEDTALNVPAPGVLANDNDPDGGVLKAVLVNGPLHGTLTLNSNGGFNYLPATNYNGSDSFTYKANDGTANSGVATVSITVNAASDAPVAANDDYTTAEDTTLNVTAPGVLSNDSDADGDALNAILVSGPTHGTLTLNANGGFSYTPTNNYAGGDSFTYKANDGTINSGIATVNITVTPVNDRPVALNDTYTTPEDTALVVPTPAIFANDSDPDGDALTALLASNPTHGTLTFSTNGTFTYVPAAHFNGLDSFTYLALDGKTNSINIATVAITVTAVNDRPIALNDTYTTPEDTALIVPTPAIFANDSDADGDTLTALLASNPTHGTLNFNTDGTFTYVPAAHFNGLDSFTYLALDGKTNSINIATVAITVTGVNDRPIALNDTYTTPEDTALIVPTPAIFANDSDPDGDVLTALLASNPTHGTLTFSTDGTFTYVPAAHFTGLDSFTYLARDGKTNSINIATVAITVTDVNDSPVAVDDSYTLNEDTTLSIPTPGFLANDTDADGDTIIGQLVAGPTHGTLTFGTDGNFTYRPDLNYGGSDSFTYRVSDGQTNSNVATVRLTINPVNDRPIALNDTYITPEDTALVVPTPAIFANDSDPDGDVLTALLASNPTHGTLTFSPNGTFTYVPAAHFTGLDSFTYLARDGKTNSINIATVLITVNARPTLNISSPTNGAVFIAPADLSLGTDAQDADGTVAKVEFFKGTDKLGELTAGESASIVWTNVPVGNHTLIAIATDNLGTRATSAPVNITVIEHTPVITLSPLHYNPLTGYFEERVRVLNPTGLTYDAARVSVFNLTNTPPITVRNPSGFSGGVAYIQSNAAVPPNGYVDITIEYYSPLGINPNPTLRSELLSPRLPEPAPSGALPGTQQHINRGMLAGNNSFVVEFATLFNRVYVVQYSPDLVNWKSATTTVLGDGGLMQWIDNELPRAVGAPTAQNMRFYRLLLQP